MKYRYYVHDKKENVGVTEYSSDIKPIFIECLCDCINWFMWESDETCFYEFTIFNSNDNPIKVSFKFVTVNDDEPTLMALFTDSISTYYIDRDGITDFIKSRF